MASFSLFSDCSRYGVPLWQCPQFLFTAMGLLNLVSVSLAYLVGQRFIEDPFLVSLLVLFLASLLLVMAFVISRSFERLVEMNRLKTEFVSVVSHQLRSPLSNLKWALEFIMSGRAGAIEKEQLPYLRILKENSSRMHSLVSDLLVVSRLDEGKVPLEASSFSFPKLLQELLGESRPMLKASNMEVQVEGDGDIELATDREKIKEVMGNFLDNAIRYGVKNGEKDEEKQKQNSIVVRYEKKGKLLRFELQDNGVGIPRQDQKHIFQKFFRSSNISKEDTQGSGLGLYIAKSLIEILEGTIGFSSKEGKGSTFWFEIPLKKA